MVYLKGLIRPLQLCTRVLQWCSAVIVMGITSFFINRNPHGEHIIYQEVISTISVAFFLPAFVSPFLPRILNQVVVGIDFIFSYLWLTAFIFAAEDYNWQDCLTHAPPTLRCSTKRANEAFIFLTFFFTWSGIFLEIFALWEDRYNGPLLEKKHSPPMADGTGTAEGPPQPSSEPEGNPA